MLNSIQHLQRTAIAVTTNGKQPTTYVEDSVSSTE